MHQYQIFFFPSHVFVSGTGSTRNWNRPTAATWMARKTIMLSVYFYFSPIQTWKPKLQTERYFSEPNESKAEQGACSGAICSSPDDQDVQQKARKENNQRIKGPVCYWDSVLMVQSAPLPDHTESIMTWGKRRDTRGLCVCVSVSAHGGGYNLGYGGSKEALNCNALQD